MGQGCSCPEYDSSQGQDWPWLHAQVQKNCEFAAGTGNVSEVRPVVQSARAIEQKMQNASEGGAIDGLYSSTLSFDETAGDGGECKC